MIDFDDRERVLLRKVPEVLIVRIEIHPATENLQLRTLFGGVPSFQTYSLSAAAFLPDLLYPVLSCWSGHDFGGHRGSPKAYPRYFRQPRSISGWRDDVLTALPLLDH